MTVSILSSVKKALGIDEFETAFDDDIVMHINTVFSTLNELAVGPTDPYSITGSEEVWTDFTGTAINLEAVKTYMIQNVRLFFDPPSTSFVLQAMKESIKELEWRLNVLAEGG